MTVLDSFDLPPKRCPSCLYFKEIAADDHPHYLEGEGCCTHEKYLGDLVSAYDSCPEYTPKIKEL